MVRSLADRTFQLSVERGQVVELREDLRRDAEEHEGRRLHPLVDRRRAVLPVERLAVEPLAERLLDRRHERGLAQLRELRRDEENHRHRAALVAAVRLVRLGVGVLRDWQHGELPEVSLQIPADTATKDAC